jgi:hypothetical protein
MGSGAAAGDSAAPSSSPQGDNSLLPGIRVGTFRADSWSEKIYVRPLMGGRRSTMTTITQEIIPNLWFDRQAEEAANYYASVFGHSKVGKMNAFLRMKKFDLAALQKAFKG